MPAAVRSRPTADPYADSDVVDARAPRFLQATVGAGAVLALATGWWWLYGLLALQLVAGLVLGRRWCLPCVAYFELVQPRVGEGRVEDARPPRPTPSAPWPRTTSRCWTATARGWPSPWPRSPAPPPTGRC